MRNTLVSALLACLISAPLMGQRVVRRVTPPPEEGLRFDSNDFPLTTLPLSQSVDFNFSPNVIFSPDSKRGFVAFPGRGEDDGDRVMVFDVATAEVLALLEVGPNPFFLTLTPDGTRIAVAALYLSDNTPRGENGFTPMKLGSIAVIDVASLNVRRLDFDDVGFSVFNNIVFSPDSSTGFIASAVTDEIIRFDVAALTETGSRLQMEGGSRPASLTMSNSGQFFTVVLPGSNALPVEDVPDSIQIIDTASFTVTASIVPEPAEVFVGMNNSVEVHHNFFGANTLAISGDDKYAIIADREGSSASFIPELASDHALIIDLEERKLFQTFNMGGGTGASAASPNGRYFSAISAVDIFFYDTELLEGTRASSGNSQFRETSRPTFSIDSSVAYVASPVLDLLNVYDVESGLLTQSIRVGEEYVRDNFQIPAGPQDVAVTPDGRTLSVLIFNGNQIELLKETFRLTAPQVITENIDTIERGGGLESVIIPPSERFFSGLAVTNHGTQDAEVIMVAEGFVQNPFAVAGFFISADPAAIQVCEVGGLGKTTLTWDVRDTTTAVEIRSGAVDGPVITTGEAMGMHETGDTVEDGTTFFLINATTGELLDTVTVNHTEVGCPAPFLLISPTTIRVCDGSGLGRTTLFWDTTDISEKPEIRVGAADGPLFADLGPTASAATGEWVTDGLQFFLVDESGTVLDEDTARLTDAGCPLSITETLKPNQQVSFTADRFLDTNQALLEDEDKLNFDGWADLDTDSDTIAGMFLTYDGTLNRIDGGSIARNPTQVSIFPEIQIRDDRLTSIEITNPTLTAVRVLFDLFDSAGDLVVTSLQTVVGNDQRGFLILGDSSRLGSVGLFDSFTGLDFLRAFPNPIQVCGTETTGMTTISWDTTGFADMIEIRVGSPDGELFASGEAAGSMDTGEDITAGTVYFLLNAENGEELDSITVRHNELGCPAPYLDATPNPIRICDGSPGGLTTLQWDATDMAEEIELRVGSVMGTLFATGGATGFATTNRNVTDGTVFHLVNVATGTSLDTETVQITREGCPLEGFTEGYLRIATPGTVSFETFGTKDYMSVLPAQPFTNEATTFVIPHFVSFEGSETTLTLINPSSIPLAGLVRQPTGEEEGSEEEEEEDPPEEPIFATVTLRANDGSALAPPLTLELPDGVMRKATIRELFGLEDTGVAIEGWIHVVADQPNLVGSAELRTFDGQAATAIALQPVEGNRFVFSHVAEGLGYGTGLVAVNPGEVAAQITIEVRNQAGTLVGSLDTILAPGERLIGLVSELFPEAGELLGGTVLLFSDQAVGQLELFFSLNERLLSAVPATRIN